MTPERFGPYTLVRRIATGGTAEIFLARRHGVDGFARHLAIKRILPHLSDRADFVRLLLDEARLAAHLHHAHIVEIHDVGLIDGRAYIAMEYLTGVDLGRLVKRAASRKRRVLLADDDPVRRAALAHALGTLPIELVAVGDRDRATAAADRGPLDLALFASSLVGPMRDPLLHALQTRHPELLRVVLLGPTGGRGYGVYAVGEADPTPDRVLELARQCLAVRVPLELSVHIVRAIADGLDAAHRATDFGGRALNIVHRDVNPSNVLVSMAGNVKLVDFGIARADNRAVWHADGDLVGTCNYMSPEQAGGREPNVCSDLFSVGVLFHELVSGVHPFEGDTPFATMRAIQENDAPPLSALVPGIPGALAEIARRAAARDPAQRYQSAAALLGDLEDFSRSEGLHFSARRLAGLFELLYTVEERTRFGVSDTGYEPVTGPLPDVTPATEAPRPVPRPEPAASPRSAALAATTHGPGPAASPTTQGPSAEAPPRSATGSPRSVPAAFSAPSPHPAPSPPLRVRAPSERTTRLLLTLLIAGLAVMAGLYWHWRTQQALPSDVGGAGGALLAPG